MRKLILIFAIVLLSACSKEFDSNEFIQILPGSWTSNGTMDTGNDVYANYSIATIFAPDNSYSDTTEIKFVRDGDELLARYKTKETGQIVIEGQTLTFVSSSASLIDFESTTPNLTREHIEESTKKYIGYKNMKTIVNYGPREISLRGMETEHIEIYRKQ
jgi:hypothetical protein